MFPKLGLPKYAQFLFRFRTPKYQKLGILHSIPYQSHQSYTLLPKICHWTCIYRCFETRHFLLMSVVVIAVIIAITHILVVMTILTKTTLSSIALIIPLPLLCLILLAKHLLCRCWVIHHPNLSFFLQV